MAKKYQAKSGFVKRTIAGETLLVPVGSTTQEFNGMIMLNETGSYMWDLLASPLSEEELTEAMKKEFDAPTDVIQSDAKEFLETGIKEGLISVENH